MIIVRTLRRDIARYNKDEDFVSIDSEVRHHEIFYFMVNGILKMHPQIYLCVSMTKVLLFNFEYINIYVFN